MAVANDGNANPPPNGSQSPNKFDGNLQLEQKTGNNKESSLNYSLLNQQQRTISGTITDENGNPLPGATVVVKGTSIGTITDVDGKFTITVDDSTAVLSISFIGYITEEVGTENQSNINVLLIPSVESLNEVVVIGYGVQKKKLITGATLQVDGDEIKKLNTISSLSALQGISPGVQIVKTSGQPGEGFKINIRGLGTTGNSNPLYIVDGVPVDNIDYLSISDIEDIDILKDAASAAIYGARAANGVIMVTTKKGIPNKTSISFDGYFGIQNFNNNVQLLNASEYAMIMNEGHTNNGQNPYDFASLVPDWNSIESGKWNGTNWLDEITVKNAPIQNYSLNITGGTDRSVYSIGLSYLAQEGILGKPVAPVYERYNFRLNTEHIVLKNDRYYILKVGENLNYGYSEKEGLAIGNIYWNNIHDMLSTSPFLPIYDDKGNYHYAIPWNTAEANPVGLMEYKNGSNLVKSHHITGNIYFELQPIKQLVFKSSYGYDLTGGSSRSFVPEFDLARVGNNYQDYNTVNHSMWLGYSLIMENTLSYKFSLSKSHHFIALVGNTAQRTGLGESIEGTNRNSIFDDFEHAYFDNTPTIASSETTLGSHPWGKGGLLSYFGRITYDYSEKYLFTAVIRADGSSNFAKRHRWGYFPSVSAGWVISDESFMENTGNWLEFLKLRASWGQNGNQNITPFQYLSTISFEGVNYFFGTNKNIPTSGAYPDILPNEYVSWETSEQMDIGFDALFLNNRLNTSFDWYNKTTKDWLVDAPALASYGTGTPYINGGDVNNRGFELGISWNEHVNTFKYSVKANLAYNTNNVTKIANEEGIIHGPSEVLSQGTAELYRAEVGYPIGYFWGFRTDGIFQNEEEVNSYQNSEGTIIMPDAVPGDVRFVDLNDDGTIDINDKTIIGDPNPDYTFGISLSAEYMGFDFSISAVGVAGNQIAKSYRSFNDQPRDNYTNEILERWHGEGTSYKLPRLSSGSHINTRYISDLYIEDGDYLRIRNITIGYDLKKIISKLPFAQVRFYFSAQNIYTITSYSGMDPEIGYAPSDYASGVDLGFYPSPRTYLVGFNFKFK